MSNNDEKSVDKGVKPEIKGMASVLKDYSKEDTQSPDEDVSTVEKSVGKGDVTQDAAEIEGAGIKEELDDSSSIPSGKLDENLSGNVLGGTEGAESQESERFDGNKAEEQQLKPSKGLLKKIDDALVPSVDVIGRDGEDKISPEDDLKKSIRPAVRFGLSVLLIGLLFFVVWGGTAPLDSAAIAPGYVVLSGKKKSIQHLEGGIIREIMIKDGDVVKKGDIIMKLEDHRSKADLFSLQEQLYSQQAIEDRLDAERDGMEEVKFDEHILMYDDPEVQKVIKTQQSLFETRGLALKGKLEVLQQRVLQKKRGGIWVEISVRCGEIPNRSYQGRVKKYGAIAKKRSREAF